MINTRIEEKQHKSHPFMIGWPLKNRKFVHVLDELTLDILLNELDTVSDFVSYLTKKEKYLTTDDVDFIISGEEELLAHYLMHPMDNFEGFSFPPIKSNYKMVRIDEGAWRRFYQSNAYLSWKEFTKVSYEWDRLIESQTHHIHQDTAQVLRNDDLSLKDIQAHELVLRAMAEEGRITRQILAREHFSILNRESEEDRLVKTIVIPNRPNRAYILLVMKWDNNIDYEEYRQLRRSSLVGFCRANRFRIEGIEEVIGIASDHSNSPFMTQDFILMHFEKDITQEDKDMEISALKAAGIWKESWKCI